MSDSTVLRNTGSIFAYSLIAYGNLMTGLNKLTVNEDVLENELNEHWEVMAEPI